jgi:hypothetical protein
MAKHPVPGRVKTRLAGALGADVACGLYRAFILDLAERLAQLPYAVTWAYWPATAAFRELVPGADCEPQRGADLGARMAHAIAGRFAVAATPVIVLGADVPHVPAAALAHAARRLHAAADLVLGPADDGGYYLVGLRRPVPQLFAGIGWGAASVLAATRARARELGLRTHLLVPSFDVDDVADVERLRALVLRGEVVLPRTAALLAALAAPR